jgi:probable rRNA maturation factor
LLASSAVRNAGTPLFSSKQWHSNRPLTSFFGNLNNNRKSSTNYRPQPVLISIKVTNVQSQVPIDKKRLREAVRMILEDESICRAKIGVAVVDDPTIAELHQRYLDDPDPTDVLSFVLERSPKYLEGEIVVSADTALSSAADYHWTAADELLLYVIHGALHLVGSDDTTPKKRAVMREKEREYLARFGLKHNTEV